MQVEYKTEKGTIIFVKVPDDSIGYSLNMFDNIPHLQLRFDKRPYGDSIEISRKRIEFNPWQLIGLTSEITEEQAKMMLGKNEMEEYKSYKENFTNPYFFGFYTAIDSFKSLMQHLEIYDVNPLGEFPTLPNFKRLPISMVERKQERWKKAQSRTGKWIVLFKPKT